LQIIIGIPYEEDPERGERHTKVANRVKANVEAIGELLLELNDGFVLKLSDVLYVSSVIELTNYTKIK
jgi:hypothetical protein